MASKKQKNNKRKNNVHIANNVNNSNSANPTDSNNINHDNESPKMAIFTSLIDLLDQERHSKVDVDNVSPLSQNEKNQILDVEHKILKTKNSELTFSTGKENEYFNIARIQYNLYLKEKEKQILIRAINNMWVCSTNNVLAKTAFYFLGLWYNELDMQAAAFTCFFYCAREFSSLSALNKLSEFYENGRQWLPKNPNLAENFKKLIKQQQIVLAKENPDIIDFNQITEDDLNKSEIKVFLESYQPSAISLEKNDATEKLVFDKNINVFFNNEESDCLLDFAINNNSPISELDFNEAYNEAKRIQQKIQHPESEIKVHGKSGSFSFENFTKTDKKTIKHTLYQKGLEFQMKGDMTSSLLLMWKAYDEGHEDALSQLSMLYYKDKNYPAAFTCVFYHVHKYQKSIHNLGYQKSLHNLACFYENGQSWLPKNKLKAFSLQQQAAEQGYGPSCYFLGLHYKAHGQLEEAILWLTKSLKSNNKDYYFNCLYTLGDIYFDRANFKKSIEYFQQMVDEASELSNNDEVLQTKINALEKLALIYLYEEGDFDMALNYCKQALKLDQSSGDLLITQGIIYQQKKEYRPSKISFELAAGKGFLEAYYCLALAYISDDCFDKQLDFNQNIHKAMECATFYISNEKESFDNIISACTMARYCLNKKLKIASLGDEEKNKLLENEIVILIKLVSTYEKLAENIKPKYKKIVISAYQHLSTYFFNKNNGLVSSYYLHLSSLLDDLESQYYLDLFYFKYSEQAIKLNNLVDVRAHYKNAAYYFSRAANQGMIKAKEYLDIILNKETELTQIKDDSNQNDGIKIAENEKNQAAEKRISISAAKMFKRIKDKKNIWQQKKTKITNIISIKKTKIDQANICWFGGAFNAKNLNLKEMVYHDGEKPAFLFVDSQLLAEHRANFGSRAAGFFEKAQFKLSQTNIKPLKGKNHPRHALKIQLPTGEIEKKECRYELKLEGKSRFLLFKVDSDDNQANLYVACEYLKNGLHNKGNVVALRDSEKSDKVVSLNWPK